ncbi:hypothetical protein JHD47_01710 [Sulfurimonas sp. SAG-AH-194-L11]|nr:hypothetical protein [Sulfurimonas sp. SAG-AH-194-L11]MDF1876532.1 hypothetical protein [Sulfurimonas sp. SAG-AH-194-L11]
MKKMLFLLSLTTLLLANKIYIIADEEISVSKKELQHFFSAKSDYLNGKKYKRVSNKEALGSLAKLMFSISKKKLSEKWIKQNFRKGIPFPLSIKNDTKTVEWIKNHPNTIGFITRPDESVHIIYTFSE